jgi:heme oxygenase
MQSTLKEATAEKHRIAERKLFNQQMFKGALNKQQYLTYLEQQQVIFTALEKNPLPHPSLQRSQALKADIDELIAAGCKTVGKLSTTITYEKYLNQLSPQEQLPHIYLHYLAIMYGGQMMKTKVPSQGHLYHFNDFNECIGSIRSIQQDGWAEEVNKGFDYIIAIFDELALVCLKEQKTV